jgi:hypothetical protein
MFARLRIAMIRKTSGVPFQYTEHPIDLGDQRHATVADNIPAVEIGNQHPLAQPVEFDP